MSYHAGMQTEAKELIYDFEHRSGTVHLAAGCCTDMEGTIALFTAIDPDVQMIQTWAGGKSDTRYYRVHGEWKAILLPRRRQKPAR